MMHRGARDRRPLKSWPPNVAIESVVPGAVSPFEGAGSSLYTILYSLGMKTTLDLNDQLLADAKALAAQQRTSLTRLIEEGLQLRLRAKAAGVGRACGRVPVFMGRGGLVAGVDAMSNRSMLAALDDDA